MKETELKELLKESFEAGRGYQYTINPYSGKPSIFSDKPSFTKWYKAKLKLLGITDVYTEELLKVNRLQQTQISLKEQIEILRQFANKLGLYDVADYLKR